MNLHKIYHPITAAPFRCTQDYMEFEPCDALKPYIRCFWGTEKPFPQEESFVETANIVTPDTCIDIIFTADFSKNVIDSSFCGIDDRTFLYPNRHREKKTFFRFAVRFYPWGVSMFAQESMKNTKNAFFDVDYHFSGIKNEIEKRLFDIENIRQLIPIAETILLNHFQEKHQNPVIFQAVSKILRARGNLAMTDLKKGFSLAAGSWSDYFWNILACPQKVWLRWCDTSICGTESCITRTFTPQMQPINMGIPTRRTYATISRNITP